MKRILNILKSIFISFEVVCILLVLNIFLKNQQIFYRFTKEVLEINSISLFILLGLPAAFISFTVKQFTRILEPKEDIKKLVNWDDYCLLKDTIWVATIWIGFSVLFTIILFIKKEDNLISTLYVAFNLAAIISCITLLNASFTVKEILAKYE